MPDPTSTTASIPIKKGQAANFVWGLSDGVNISTYGRVLSFDTNRTSDKEPLPDANGETDGMVYYNLRDEGTLEAIIPTSGLSGLEIATTASINNKTYLIEGFKQNWTRGAWAKVTITLAAYPAIVP